MKRERLLWGFILFAALAAFWAVYQFYFKQKLADYAKDAAALRNAQDAYAHLSEIFQNTDPEGVVTMWREVVQPWKEAVLDRGKYFNDGEWWKHTEPADDVAILRFWYDEQMKKDLTSLYTAIQQTPGIQQYPTDYNAILKEFGVLTLPDFRGEEVTKKDVNRELGKLATGIQAYKMLLKAKVSYISHVWLWPAREIKEHDGVLRLWTFGLDFGIDMKGLANFIDNDLRTASRFWNIEGIKIQYPYVGYNVEPVLRVQMLLTSASFVAAKSGTDDNVPIAASRGATPGTVVNTLGLKNAPPKAEEPTGFWAWWKWFKTDILYLR